MIILGRATYCCYRAKRPGPRTMYRILCAQIDQKSLQFVPIMLNSMFIGRKFHPQLICLVKIMTTFHYYENLGSARVNTLTGNNNNELIKSNYYCTWKCFLRRSHSRVGRVLHTQFQVLLFIIKK